MSTLTPPSPSKDAQTLPLPATTPGSQAPSTTGHPVIPLARHLLAILTAVCTFGAGIAFDALQSGGSTGRAFLAWAFAAFAIGIVTTLIWQAALVADFRTFTGRMYRSHTGILVALSVGTCCAIIGTLLLSLSITRHDDLSIRAAGYTVLAVLGLLVGASALRLISTAIRRRAVYIRKRKKQSPRRESDGTSVWPVAPDTQCLDYICSSQSASIAVNVAVLNERRPVHGAPIPAVDKVPKQITGVAESDRTGPSKPSRIADGPNLCAPEHASMRNHGDVEGADPETDVD